MHFVAYLSSPKAFKDFTLCKDQHLKLGSLGSAPLKSALWVCPLRYCSLHISSELKTIVDGIQLEEKHYKIICVVPASLDSYLTFGTAALLF